MSMLLSIISVRLLSHPSRAGPLNYDGGRFPECGKRRFAIQQSGDFIA
jgi:hypothetical protein